MRYQYRRSSSQPATTWSVHFQDRACMFIPQMFFLEVGRLQFFDCKVSWSLQSIYICRCSIVSLIVKVRFKAHNLISHCFTPFLACWRHRQLFFAFWQETEICIGQPILNRICYVRNCGGEVVHDPFSQCELHWACVVSETKMQAIFESRISEHWGKI